LDGFQRDLVELLPRLRRMARVIAQHPADADDLVQVSIERALLHSEQWKPGTRLDSWMYRIMKNAWIDETRQRARAGRVFADTDQAEAVADPTSASAELRLQASEAERALSTLPEEQRLAVALVLIEGLSYREAAETLEIPMGTLTSRLVRGRMSLMEQLEGYGS
jgi:RNA polymerase sigma-70 factor (ECF subfamily)